MCGTAQRVEAEPLGLGEHGLEQARLADPHRTGDQECTAGPRRGALQGAQRRGEFSLPPLDGRVEEPGRPHRRTAGQLALQRQRLLRGLDTQPREFLAQQSELACGPRPVATRRTTAHERPMSLLVGGILSQHLLPAALRAHHRQAALAQRRARPESPLRVRFVGQQVSPVGIEIATLEPFNVGGHLGGRRQFDHAAAKHDRTAIAEGPAHVARRLVQIGRGGVG